MLDLVILCAGPGKRLRPLTLLVPKPLIPLPTCPHVAQLVHRLASVLSDIIDRVYLVLAYCASAYADPAKVCVEALIRKPVEIIIDTELRGTAGQLVKLAEYSSTLADYILIVNGDLFLDDRACAEIRRGIDKVLREKKFDLIIFSAKKTIRFGIVRYRSDNVFIEWVEKPVIDVVSGIYMMSSRVLKFLSQASTKKLDMNELVRMLVEAGYRVGVLPLEGLVEDIGVVEDYIKAVSMLSEANLNKS